MYDELLKVITLLEKYNDEKEIKNMYDELLKVITLLEKYNDELDTEKTKLYVIRNSCNNEYKSKFEDMFKQGIIRQSYYGINGDITSYSNLLNGEIYFSMKEFILRKTKEDVRYIQALKRINEIEKVIEHLQSQKTELEVYIGEQ